MKSLNTKISSNIKVNSEGRYVLDTYTKVIDYILLTSSDEEITLDNCVLIPQNQGYLLFDFQDLVKLAKEKQVLENLGITINESNEIIVTKRFKCQNSIFEKAKFSNITFKKYVGFENSQILSSYFDKSSFLEYLCIKDTSIHTLISFEGCKIKTLYWNNLTVNGSHISFTNTCIGAINLISSSFNYDNDTIKEFEEKPELITYDINFALSAIGEIFIYKIQTSLSISFMESTINKSVSIVDCDFSKGIIFEGCKIKGRQVILENRSIPTFNINRFISLKNAHIESDFCINNFSCQNFIADGVVICKDARLCIFSSDIRLISMIRLLIYGEVSVQKLAFLPNKTTTMCMTYAINLGTVNVEPENLNIADYATAKLLRQAAQKLNNNIEAISFKAIEHHFFLEKKKKQFRCNISHIAEFLLLWLNNISSQFGTNWIRGILFCLVVSALSTGIIGLAIDEYSLSLNIKDWIIFSDDFWSKTFEFLWLPNLQNFEELMNHQKCNAFAILLFIVGKSLIAYGIYQTISSFRKYSK